MEFGSKFAYIYNLSDEECVSDEEFDVGMDEVLVHSVCHCNYLFIFLASYDLGAYDYVVAMSTKFDNMLQQEEAQLWLRCWPVGCNETKD